MDRRGDEVSPRDKDPAQKVLLVVCVAVLVGILVISHVPGLNGPWYWQWPWRRLDPLRVFPALLAAAVPFFIGQLVYATGTRRGTPALALMMLSTFAMQVIGLGIQEDSFRLEGIFRIIQHPLATSYFTDAVRLKASAVTATPGWLALFPDLLPQFHLHSLTKPPGPILYHLGFIHTFGPSNEAALRGGLFIGVLATLGIPATYYLIKILGEQPGPAFHGASFFALSPAIVLFFPSFDQVYPVFACLMLVTWVRVVDAGTYRHTVMFGLSLAAALFFSYSLLVLGTFLAGIAALRLLDRRATLATVVRLSAVAFGVVGIVYLGLWALTGFDPTATFRAALRNQEVLLTQIHRPYPQTVLFDLLDFALGAGWISFLLTAFFVSARLRTGQNDARFRIVLLCILQFLIVAVTGLLPGETARVWLFMLPLLMLPVGLELARWRLRQRMAVYLSLWFVTAAICQNITFIGYR